MVSDMLTDRRFLIEEGYVDPALVERRLALQCLRYLSSLGFRSHLQEEIIIKYILDGYYAFMDYAVVYWAKHLEAAIAVLTHENENVREEFIDLIGIFLEVHWCGTDQTTTVPERVKTRFEQFSKEEFFENLTTAVAVASKNGRVFGNRSTHPEVLQLTEIVQSVRSQLERQSEAEGCNIMELQTKLKEFYGPNWFKCPRVNCAHFYLGFQKADERREHLYRHERYYLCKVEGCHLAIIGCTTERELQKHVKENHAVKESSDDEEFPPQQLAKPTNDKTNQRVQCVQCGKRFAQKYNLKAHLMTHTEEKPYQCSECSEVFRRFADRVRHEKCTHSIFTLDSTKESWICGGQLKNSTRWGCGKVFGRKDYLNRHYISNEGKHCARQREEGRALETEMNYAQEQGCKDRDITGQAVKHDELFSLPPIDTERAGKKNFPLPKLSEALPNQSASCGDTSSSQLEDREEQEVVKFSNEVII
jgi:hypothetical protein